MEIQLRCDQVESVKSESIKGGLNPLQRQTGDSDDGDGPDELYCCSCVTCSFNGQPCQHPDSHLHMAHHQHSCWRSVKPPCQRATHTLPKVTDGASKNHRPFTGSIIDFIPKLLLRTCRALHTNFKPLADRHEGQISCRLQQFLLWEVGEARSGSFFGDLLTQIHNTPTHNLPDLPLYWVCSQEAHQWNCRFSQVRIFLCNQASNEWAEKTPELPRYTVYGVQALVPCQGYITEKCAYSSWRVGESKRVPICWCMLICGCAFMCEWDFWCVWVHAYSGVHINLWIKINISFFAVIES